MLLRLLWQRVTSSWASGAGQELVWEFSCFVRGCPGRGVTALLVFLSPVEGHDSSEDARACMELMVWKIKEDAKVKR